MAMKLVTTTDRRMRNAFTQFAGTDPGGDCRNSYLQDCSQIWGKQSRNDLLWKRFLHPLWDAVGEWRPILRWLWRTTQLFGPELYPPQKFPQPFSWLQL
jgi:hypothetical protein